MSRLFPVVLVALLGVTEALAKQQPVLQGTIGPTNQVGRPCTVVVDFGRDYRSPRTFMIIAEEAGVKTTNSFVGGNLGSSFMAYNSDKTRGLNGAFDQKEGRLRAVIIDREGHVYDEVKASDPKAVKAASGTEVAKPVNSGLYRYDCAVSSPSGQKRTARLNVTPAPEGKRSFTLGFTDEKNSEHPRKFQGTMENGKFKAEKVISLSEATVQETLEGEVKGLEIQGQIKDGEGNVIMVFEGRGDHEWPEDKAEKPAAESGK